MITFRNDLNIKRDRGMNERLQKFLFGAVSFALVIVSVLIASCFSYLDYDEVGFKGVEFIYIFFILI